MSKKHTFKIEKTYSEEDDYESKEHAFRQFLDDIEYHNFIIQEGKDSETDEITVNKIELATEIANFAMDEVMAGSSWMKEDPYEVGNFVIKEEYKSDFNHYYDRVLTLINNCGVK